MGDIHPPYKLRKQNCFQFLLNQEGSWMAFLHNMRPDWLYIQIYVWYTPLLESFPCFSLYVVLLPKRCLTKNTREGNTACLQSTYSSLACRLKSILYVSVDQICLILVLRWSNDRERTTTYTAAAATEKLRKSLGTFTCEKEKSRQRKENILL